MNLLGLSPSDFFCRAQDFFGFAFGFCTSACRRKERIVGVHRRDIRAVVHEAFNRRYQSRKGRMREPHGSCRHRRAFGHHSEKRRLEVITFRRVFRVAVDQPVIQQPLRQFGLALNKADLLAVALQKGAQGT